MTIHEPDPNVPDPMAERRRNSTEFYDGVDAAIAAHGEQPSYTTRTTPHDDGYSVEHDDGYGTVINVLPASVGRFRLEVTSMGDTVEVDLPLVVANVLDSVIRAVAGIGYDAPIVGHR